MILIVVVLDRLPLPASALRKGLISYPPVPASIRFTDDLLPKPLSLITGGTKLPGGNAGESALDVGPSDPSGADIGLSNPGVTGLGEGTAMPLLLNVGFDQEWQGEEFIGPNDREQAAFS
jgi:hypothetical protein